MVAEVATVEIKQVQHSKSIALRDKPVTKVAKRKAIQGRKGGDKPKTPVETPDSLRSIAYAKILDLVSEGQIVGFVSGTGTDALKDIYLDETPIANADGSLNFKNVQVDSRVGTQNQDYIKSFPAVENEISVNTELKQVAAWSRASTNLTLSAIRVRLSVNALSKSDLTTGDIKGYRIEYAIDVATDGGAFVEVIHSAFDGKSSGVYEKSHRIDLPDAVSTGWVIRVRRITENAGSAYIQDITNVVSLTEIIDAKFRYPNSALVGIQIDASQFQNIPRRAFHLKGRIIQVPTNYNPDTRVYTGTWDGTFKAAWTDNPAWIFYDLATHPRYGLGHLISSTIVDKWALYGISQYCDELVPDGNGGMEPRFTCNLFLQQQADAYKVLQDLASIFRGICYWSNGSIIPVADRPSDPVYIYTNANVVGGQFRYEGSGRRARHTVALVSWSDPSDFGRAKVEYVDDPVGVARYGIQQTEVIAVGCTSQAGAQRIGRWALLTERLETNTCTWTVGLDGTYAVPGQIVRVADRNRAGRRIGGRITSMAANKLSAVIDSPIGVDPVAGDQFSVISQDGTSATRTVTAYNSGTRTVTVSVAFPSVAVVGAAWALETATLAAQNYRVLSVTETTDDTKGFTIVGLEHNDSKFDAVDFGTAIDTTNTSVIPSSVQLPPATVTLTSAERAGSVVSALMLTASWPAALGAVKYRIQWKKGNGNWGPKMEVNGLSAELGDTVFPDIYMARVYAVNSINIVSPGRNSAAYNVADQLKQPTSLVDAATNAAAAAAQAAAANAEIANITSDNILAKGEKGRVIIDWNQIINDQPALDSQATAFSITTEKTNYDSAVTALSAYLTSLAPSWSDTTQNTPIVGATFRSKFADVYTKRQVLLNKIDTLAKSAADAAQATANTAATNATAANNDIANIASDNYLSPVEKKRVLNDWNVIANEKAGIDAQAAVYSIDTELDTYDSAYTALGTYLLSLTPSWSDLTSYTPVVGATLRAKFADTYNARQVLLQKIADVVMYGTQYVSSENLLPNSTFISNRIGAPQGVFRALGKPVTDGWTVSTAGTMNNEAGIFLASPGNVQVRVYGQTALANGGNRQATMWTAPMLVQGGKTYEFGFTTSGNSLNGTIPSGVSAVSQMAVRWYTSAGALLSYTEACSRDRTSGNAYATLVAPATATQAIIELKAYIQNSSGASWTHNSTVAMNVNYTSAFMRKLDDLAVAGSGYQLGDLRNQIVTGVGSVGSRWSGAAISYTIPTTGSPATITFNVASGTLQCGSAAVAYSASSTTASQARSTTVTYYFYYIDKSYAGGTKTLNVTTNAQNIANADDRVWIGTATVTTPATGTGGGGGGDPGGGCVDGSMWIDAQRQAEKIVEGDYIEVIGEERRIRTTAPRVVLKRVQKNRIRIQPCYRIRTEGGAFVAASESTPMTLRDGTTRLIGEMLGCEVVTLRGNRAQWEKVVEVTFVGNRPVSHITVHDTSYFAGADPDYRIATHNSTFKP